MRIWPVSAGLLLALCLGAPSAVAHAFLDHAQPAVGSTLRAPPAELRLWFTEPLEPSLSSLELQNEAGQRVDKTDSHPDPADPKVLVAALPPLPPGRYKVVWRVVSVDTHPTNGEYKFTIGP
jgi:copper resistance protein C